MEKGFTLVELLVVIALFSLLAAVGADIFAPMIRAYNKANIQNEVNQNGRYTLSLLEQQIRNAKRVVNFNSDVVSSSIQIEDYDNNLVTFDRGEETADCPAGKNNGYLRITRVGQNPVTNAPLTNRDKKKGVNVKNFNIDVNTLVSPNIVSIKLQLAQACAASPTVDYLAEATFSTTVTLRNY
jgi:prepilin-type N-terminal cleavage/methylation domain-containing protein